MSKFQNDSIFWIEVEKIKPNPYQPRREFDQDKLNYLAESIRQYGVLQPLVVTRHEVQKEDGGLKSEYELIAGERRLRASKIAGLLQVPVIIRTQEDDAGAKLELAIIENLQREDLNPIDRAVAFQQLATEFNFKHNEIAIKVGKSREYVTNTLRLLLLPEEMQRAISSGQITEGHSRPILMLKDRPEEQATLFKEIIFKRLTVRDAESIARKVAVDKVRKKHYEFDPEIAEMEGQLSESLGTRVQIDKKDVGGRVMIDFFSNDDLRKILEIVHSNEKKNPHDMLDNYIKTNGIVAEKTVVQAEKETEQENVDLVNALSGETSSEENIINLGDKNPEDTKIKEEKEKVNLINDLDDSNIELIPNNKPYSDEEENNLSPKKSFDLNNLKKEDLNLTNKNDDVELIPGGSLDDEDDLYSVKDFTI